ncbi:hypothetical protein ASPCAL04299 [Aspergillus calidoustus]|uniref:Zn(2)-C6 fungal-type domain-containing protein n=1 Tax=Aspergillus calidoustus TaxID=454130 RepID=A0A0U5FV34_ASPCI|nr:hypothetical protein ASPCAL04299 [Aspergillus calidoustus]
MSSPRPSKRQRICRACDQCRRRKSKCDGEQPVCKICRAAGRTCSYENGGGRRGLPTGYVRGLEVALGLVFQHIPDSQATLLKLLRDSQTDRSLALETWRKSKVASQISTLAYPSPRDSALADGDCVLDDEEWEDHGSHDISSNLPAPVAAPDTTSHDIHSLHPLPVAPSTRSQKLRDLSLPPDTADLIDMYYIHTHSWLPVIERRDLLRTMYTYSTDSSSPGHSHRLLWAVVAYAIFISGRDGDSIPDPGYVLSSIQQEVLAASKTWALGDVQTLVILVLFYLGKGEIQSAWVLLGQTVRMLVVMQHSQQEQGRFVNTFHACSFLDCVTSSLMNRAPSLSFAEHSALKQVDEDGMEEWDSWNLRTQGDPMQPRSAPKGPLRSLSILNQLSRFALLSSRALYCPLDIPARHGILSEAQESRNATESLYPYRGLDTATPPLVTLHLTGAFTLLSALRRFDSKGPGLAELTVATCHGVLDLLADYVKMTGTARSSPLLGVFALQCQLSLETLSTCTEYPAMLSIKSRLSEYQAWVQGNDVPSSDGQAVTPVGPVTNDERSKTAAFSAAQITTLDESAFLLSNTRPKDPARASNAGVTKAPYPTPSSSIPTNLAPSSQSPALLGDTDAFDELFEELVTTIPNTRFEPEFAHNLGFYAGDLEADFLTQLNQPPGS